MKNPKDSSLQFPAVAFLVLMSWLLGRAELVAQEHSLDEIVVQSTGAGKTLTDQAQPVSVLSGAELDMKSQGSLGDTLASEPGITSSSFGPGAGRPVIRGFDGDRIRVLENGVGSQDLSALSPDHAVTIQSSLVDKIEVVRGPAALLYGTSAVGGVVNIFDNRIPEKLPQKPVEGTAEVRGESVNQGRSALMSVTAPIDSFAVHVDGFSSKSDDYHIPGYARTAALRESTPLEYPEPEGTLTYSDTQTDVVSAGGSYIADKGFFGAAVQDYKTIYGVPNGEPDVSVNAHRRRLDVRTGMHDTGGLVDSGTFKAGIVDYDHTEFEGEEAGTKFKQNGVDARLDLQHKRYGDLSGTWGLQFQDNDFKALGEEAFQPPTNSETYSLFLLEEYQLLDDVKLQAGGRYDWNYIDTAGFDDETSDDSISRGFDSFSQSGGAVWDVINDYSLALSVAHTERAPSGQELFADGRHVATGVYEIGDADLAMERSLGTDLTVRKSEGEFRGFIGGFYNRFWDYISANPTGAVVEGLPEYQFENINADFWGFESQVAWHLVDTVSRGISFDLQPDYVWARDRDTHDYVPRIPPLRLKVGANVFDERYVRARAEVQHVFAQDKTAPNETSTDAYTMLTMYVSKEISLESRQVEIFLRGTNLLSDKARNHVSFIKDVAPLPGASAMAGIRINF
jgi:iron complex outermembrane receptor protein